MSLSTTHGEMLLLRMLLQHRSQNDVHPFGSASRASRCMRAKPVENSIVHRTKCACSMCTHSCMPAAATRSELSKRREKIRPNIIIISNSSGANLRAVVLWQSHFGVCDLRETCLRHFALGEIWSIRSAAHEGRGSMVLGTNRVLALLHGRIGGGQHDQHHRQQERYNRFHRAVALRLSFSFTLTMCSLTAL